jgi:ribosomal protein S9
MVVKLADGSTVTVSLTGTTTYHSEASASAGDVQAGTAVRVQLAGGGTPGQTPAPGSSVSRTLTATDVLITGP